VGKLDGEEGTSVADPPSLKSKKEIYLSGKCMFAAVVEEVLNLST